MVFIDYFMIFLYFCVLSGVVIASRKAKTMEEFAVGSRQIPSGIILATLSATYIGPGYAMGLANKAADSGYIWVYVFFAFSLQTLLVGFFVAPKLREYSNAYTLADIMGCHYGKSVKVLSGIMSVLLCAGFVGAITNAAGEIIHNITGISFIWAVILSTLVVIIYSAIGGIKTVVLTDAVQFIVLAISIPVVMFFLLKAHGVDVVVEKTSNTTINPLSTKQLVALLASFLLGETLVPPYANRALMSKDKNHARNGFVLAGIFSLFWFFVCASIGVIGKELVAPDSSNVFLSILRDYLPVGLYGLAIAALISIIMSSQDSLINAAAVSFSNDLLGSFSPTKWLRKYELSSTRVITLIVGGLGAWFAINVKGVIPALLICYTLWAPTIVLPLIFAVTYKKVSCYSGLPAIVCGGFATGIWEWGLKSPYGIPSILVGIGVNLFVFWVVHFLTRNWTIHKLFIPVGHKG